MSTRTREPWTLSEKFFLGAFLFWSMAGLIFTFGRLTPVSVGEWGLPVNLRDFVDLCIYSGDPILIILAFANTHLQATRQWTAGVARAWAVVIILGAFVIETIGTLTGLPFGDYHYTGRFGPQIWLVPLTIPLAWHVIVTNALFVVRAAAPHVSRLVEAVVVGAICTLYDFILEPFATTIKNYWAWTNGGVPIENYLAWFIISTLLVRFFAPTLSSRFRTDPRPALVLAFTVFIFLAGEFATRFYR